jgi:hypothetical protein
MGRSGSTWSFNVVKLLMREHSETTHACYTDDVASSFMEAGARPEHIIVKCHVPDYFGRFLIKHRMCRTVYTFREPLEVLTSALETFGGEFEPHLNGLTASLDLLQFQAETGGVHAIWYDDILERSPDRVAALADYLGIDCSRQRSDEIAAMMERENVRRILLEMSKSARQTKTASRFSNRPDKVTSWDSGTLFSDHHIRKAPSTPEDFLTPEQVSRAIAAFSGFVDAKGKLLDVVKNIGRLDAADHAKSVTARQSLDVKPSEIVSAARQAFEGRFGDPASPKDFAPDDGVELNAVLARLTPTPTEPAAAEPIVVPPTALPHIEPDAAPAAIPQRKLPGTSPFALGPNQRLMQAPQPPDRPAAVQPQPMMQPLAGPPAAPPAPPATPALPTPAVATLTVSPPAMVASSAIPSTIQVDAPIPPTPAEIAAERVLNRRSRNRQADEPVINSRAPHSILPDSATALAEPKPRSRPSRPSIDPETGEAMTPAELAARFVLARRHQQAEIPAPRALARVKPPLHRMPAPKVTWADVEQDLQQPPSPVTEKTEGGAPTPPVRQGSFVANALRAIGKLTWGRGRANPAPNTTGGTYSDFPIRRENRRMSPALCRRQSPIGMAGYPATTPPGSMSRITPLFPAILAPLPIVK